jgi:Zn-dependent M28 family amino/carboxypeptidase
MKKIVVLCSICLLFSCSSSKSLTTKLANLEKSNPVKYLSSITASELEKHLYIVAADSMQGRDTGSEGQKKAGRYLIAEYQKMGISFPKEATSFYQKVPAAFMKRSYSPTPSDSENIWTIVEGTEKPEEIVVISAHYDHVGTKNVEIYNGADDDGSGTVALLEIAQAFQQAKNEGNGPKRSILFLHVTGEEKGLHGSRYYAENPLFPLKNTIANINIDMIGRRDDLHKDSNNYVYVIGSDRLSTDLHKINEEANTKYTNLDLDYKYNDINDPERIYYRSDHYNFAKNGIPAIFFFNGVHDDYHLPTDTPDKIEYDALAKRTQLAFATAWELANRAERPVVDRDGK